MSTTLEPKARVTPEELLSLEGGKGYELVNGELVERHVSAISSMVGGEILSILRNHCKPIDLAWIFGADQGFRCYPDDPGRVRKPDVSLVLKRRLPAEGLEIGFIPIPPDLAVEVVSPNDLAEEIEDKVMEYLSAGVRLVWVVYPSSRSIHVRRPDGSSATLRASDVLDGEDVVPGFSVRVEDLFPPAATKAV